VAGRLAPRIEEVGAERDDEPRGVEVDAREGRAERGAVGRDRRQRRLGIVRQVRRQAEPGQPLIEERREASQLVLIDEGGVGGGAAAAHGAELLAQTCERLVPGGRHQLTTLAHHRRAPAIGVVEPLQRGLAARGERAAVGGMLRISLELDDPSVAHLGQHAHRLQPFTTDRRVVVGDLRNRVVRIDDVGNQPTDVLGRAADERRGGAGGAEDLEEVAALDAGGPRLSAHAVERWE
jgi:hypothetical protein